MDQRRKANNKRPAAPKTHPASVRRTAKAQAGAAVERKLRAGAVASRKKQRAQKRMRMTVACCIAALLAIGGMYILFSRDVPDAMPTSAQSSPEGAGAAAMYTPVPTPRPTPAVTPEPTEQPEPTARPTPTPYVYQTEGRALKVDRKMIALTFDDGPSTKVTPRILDILKKYKVKATFFQLGENAMKNPSLTRRVVEEGHQIATHSYDHPNLSTLSEDEIRWQVERSVLAIEDACGVRPRILRPPYGAVGGLVKPVVDMPMVNWTVDTEDWKDRSAKGKVKAIYNHMLSDTKDGDIILCHDLYSTTADAVEKAIPALKKLGFQFVTVDELYEARGPHLEAGKLTLSAHSAKDMDP